MKPTYVSPLGKACMPQRGDGGEADCPLAAASTAHSSATRPITMAPASAASVSNGNGWTGSHFVTKVMQTSLLPPLALLALLLVTLPGVAAVPPRCAHGLPLANG